jgi:hypothetical protein
VVVNLPERFQGKAEINRIVGRQQVAIAQRDFHAQLQLGLGIVDWCRFAAGGVSLLVGVVVVGVGQNVVEPVRCEHKRVVFGGTLGGHALQKHALLFGITLAGGDQISCLRVARRLFRLSGEAGLVQLGQHNIGLLLQALAACLDAGDGGVGWRAGQLLVDAVIQSCSMGERCRQQQAKAQPA